MSSFAFAFPVGHWTGNKMPRPCLLQCRIANDQQLQLLLGGTTVPRRHVPDSHSGVFARYADEEMIPYMEAQDEGVLRDVALNSVQVRALINQVQRGDQYQPVDTDGEGRAVPNATIQFASGKRGRSMLGLDLFLFEVPVAYEVLGPIRCEFVKRGGNGNGNGNHQLQFAVRVAYQQRVVATVRGYVVRRKGNQYHPRDILLLKCLQKMTGGTGGAADEANERVAAASGEEREGPQVAKWPVIELVMHIVNKPGDADRTKAQGMMAAADELYVDVRVREYETQQEAHKIFFHGRGDGSIERNVAPRSLQSALPAVAA